MGSHLLYIVAPITSKRGYLVLAMQGVSDPEKKRKVIGAGFIRVFDEFATKLKSDDRIKPRFLVQVVTSHSMLEDHA